MRISRTTATLPDLECPGIKPVSREACRTTDCVRSENLLMDGGGGGSEISNKIDRLTPGGGFSSETDGTDDDNDEEEDDVPAPAPASKAQYTWRSEEMTACSASCLGGKNVFTATLFMVFTEARFPLLMHTHRNTGVGD